MRKKDKSVESGKTEDTIINRNNKKKKRKSDPNLLIKLTVLFLIIIGLVIAYIICSFLPAFNVKKISVNENQLKHYSKEEIISSIKQDMYANIIKINISEMQEDILKLPYVKKVEINKFFPSTLQIQIYEKEPYYVIEKNNKYILLDDTSKVLEIVEEYELNENQFLISGVEIDENTVPGTKVNSVVDYKLKTARKIYLKFIERIENREFSRVEYNGKEINVIIDQEIKVLLPSSEDFDYEMRFLNEILKHIEEKKIFIDMTKDNPYSKEVN